MQSFNNMATVRNFFSVRKWRLLCIVRSGRFYPFVSDYIFTGFYPNTNAAQVMWLRSLVALPDSFPANGSKSDHYSHYSMILAYLNRALLIFRGFLLAFPKFKFFYFFY